MSHESHAKPPRRIVLESLLALLVGFGLAFAVHELFGEEFATRQQAKAFAPFAGNAYGNGARDQVRVLLIDDAALAAAGQSWPAQYAYSARVLRAVSQYQPKAVFVDIAYTATRPDASLPALTAQLCAMKQQGIPVFLAATRNSEHAFTLRPELEALAGECFDKVAVKYSPDAIDRLAWTYNLDLDAEEGKPAVRSAALALAAAAGVHAEAEEHPLALTWGGTPAAHGVGWVVGSEGRTASYCRSFHGSEELLPPGIFKRLYADAAKPVCVFHDTLHADELVATSDAAEQRLRRELQGKLVLIGTALSDSNDLVLSPLHDRIPGVYLHAMATDNLLVYGDAYPRHMHLAFNLHNIKLLVFLLGSLLVVTLLPKAVREWLGARHGWVESPLDALLARLPDNRLLRAVVGTTGFIASGVIKLALAVFIGVALLWFGHRFLGLGYLSIIGVVFLTVTAEWLELNEKLAKYLLPEARAPHAQPPSSEEKHDDHTDPVAHG